MNAEQMKKIIGEGQTYLGIEFGSTRIKAVLIDDTHAPIASGSHAWENRLENGVWTYSLEDVWAGLKDCYRDLCRNVKERCGASLQTVGALGISGMMHGYMPFDGAGRLLTPFRTWRNTITGEASARLTGLFGFNIPQRWSIAHLYQAMLNGEDHVKDIAYMTTLAGWQLTGEKRMGVGEASGMFPINGETGDYDENMLAKFNGLLQERGLPFTLGNILPKVLPAGAPAGSLTLKGAKLLDPTGTLKPGVPMCPPEGDAGTGMTATNSVGRRTGNVSAGTSVFAMAVLEKKLSAVYPQIDMVATPGGDPVAMVHCNNCTGDLDAWVGLFKENLALFGLVPDPGTLYTALYEKAMEGDSDCGGLLAYNYISGEHVTEFERGKPLFLRGPEDAFNLANFMRTHLYTSLGALRTGMNILFDREGVRLSAISGHGGFFKTRVGQRVMAAALNTPVTVMQTAGEGGPWGMAILAAYMRKNQGETLEAYLARRVFAGSDATTLAPDPADAAGFNAFMERYAKGLSVERAAVEAF